MADVLVDTTVWVDFFRSNNGAAGDLLDDLLGQDRAALCGIVEMEVYQGLKAEERESVESAFRSLPYVQTTRQDFIAAGMLWNSMRKRGVTIPSSDCLVATLCMNHGLSLLSNDRHFDAIMPDVLKRIKP